MTRAKGYSEIVAAVIFGLAGLVVLFHLIPAQIMDPSPTIPNAKTFPYLLGGVFTLLCIKWLFDSCIAVKKEGAAHGFPGKLLVGLAIGSVFLGIGFLIGKLGYLFGGTICTFLVIIAIEGRTKLVTAILGGIITTVMFSIIFGKLLHIEIPAGIISFL